MRPMALLAAVAAIAAAAGCSSTDPYAPIKQDACITNNTAQVRFTNALASNRAMDAYMNGQLLATVAPGKTSSDVTVRALILYVAKFNLAGTDSLACPLQLVTPHQCGEEQYYCRG